MLRLLLPWVLLFAVALRASAQAVPEPDAPAEAPIGVPAPADRAEELFRQGVEAWLAGQRQRARERWSDALPWVASAPLEGALRYNLGNSAWHRERPLEAVAWYTSALRFWPRDPDLLDNLDLARLEAGLAPRDRGDLASLFERYLGMWTQREARWLCLCGLLVLAAGLLGEAIRGGLGWRLVALGTLSIAALAAAPLVHLERQAAADLGLLVHPKGVSLAAEPAGSAGASEGGPFAEPGAVLRRLDRLPGWVRVEARSGQRGWVRTEDFFPLRGPVDGALR